MFQVDFVFWVICLLGILSALVFLERMIHLRRAQIDYQDLLKGVCNVLAKENTDEAMMLCEETPGPAAAVVLTAVRHQGSDRDSLADVLENTKRAETARLERRIAILSLSCQIAPLLGLLGSFICALPVLQSFQDHAPVVQNTDLLGGLSQAFGTAIAGLIVAIECHIFFSLLLSRIEQLVLDMETCASEMIAFLTRPAAAESEHLS